MGRLMSTEPDAEGLTTAELQAMLLGWGDPDELLAPPAPMSQRWRCVDGLMAALSAEKDLGFAIAEECMILGIWLEHDTEAEEKEKGQG